MSITKSPWVIHYDGSSCNGCDIEVLACLTPMYDVERFGIINTGNPKHADVFLVTGAINEQNIPVVKQIYDQMPSPKAVVAIGICAATGGVFRDCYNIVGGVDQVIPVDVYVPGCAARPEAIIDGVVKGLGVLAERQAALKKSGAVAEEVKGGYMYEGPHDDYGTLITDEDEDGAAFIAGEAEQASEPLDCFVADAPRNDEGADAPRNDEGADAPRNDEGVDAPRNDEGVDAPRNDEGVDAPRNDEGAGAEGKEAAKND